MSPAQVVKHWLATSGQSRTRRLEKIRKALDLPSIDEGAGEQLLKTMASELDGLPGQPYFDKLKRDEDLQQSNLHRGYAVVKECAPKWFQFLESLLRNPRSHEDTYKKSRTVSATGKRRRTDEMPFEAESIS